MVTVDRDSANWRLFGGGGLAIGGLLWLIAVIVTAVQAGPISSWLWIIGVTVVGVALFFVAFAAPAVVSLVATLVVAVVSGRRRSRDR